MFILRNISYIHPDKELLFDNISLSAGAKEKVALIGNNGSGKSTLLKIIAGQLGASAGTVNVSSKPCFVPQIFGQFDALTIAQALNIDKKLTALYEVLSGKISESNLLLLNDDWTIEERCHEALSYWQLEDLDLTGKLISLSGGQKTKVFLAAVQISNPEIILLDEPTNHLDTAGRELLYRFIAETAASIVAVSHDRILLNQFDTICELNRHGIKTYGGNYEFYRGQKTIENEAFHGNLEEKQKLLKKARKVERETLERQQRMDSRGKSKQEKSGLARILMDTKRNQAENSTSKMKSVHAEKISAITHELNNLRKEIPDNDKIKFGFENSAMHTGKILVKAKGINYAYGGELLWRNSIDFQIVSGERILLKGNNGSGKTTLLKLILGDIEPTTGAIFRADNKTLYIDQDYSLINDTLTVYEQARSFNNTALQEHEIKIRLNRFLFTKDFWDKPCALLSGGERMRLLLCCLTVTTQSPDIVVLDEPTNNIDIQNIEMLTAAINEYRGTLIVVSHDLYFAQQINIEKEFVLK
jgi:ATPase subunit of ABC transporter with duplicated ATPase domains